MKLLNIGDFVFRKRNRGIKPPKIKKRDIQEISILEYNLENLSPDDPDEPVGKIIFEVKYRNGKVEHLSINYRGGDRYRLAHLAEDITNNYEALNNAVVNKTDSGLGRLL